MQKIDESIMLFFQGFHCALLTKLSSIFIPVEFWNVIAVVLIFYYLFRANSLKVPVISFVLAKSMAYFSYELIKNLVQRPRPFFTVQGLVPIMTPHGYSFPSGHATLAMAMAVVFSHHFPKSRFALYSLAVLVGLSRVYLGVHYLTDVLGGFLLGAAVGRLSIYLERSVIMLSQGVDLKKPSGSC